MLLTATRCLQMRFPCSSSGGQCVPPLLIPALPGAMSEWAECGSRLDTLNDGEWTLQAVASLLEQRDRLHFTVEFAVLGGFGPDGWKTIGSFEERGCFNFDVTGGQAGSVGPGHANSCDTILAYDADTKYSGRIRRVEAQLFEVMERVDAHRSALPPHAKKPTETLVTCTDCFPNSSDVADPRYNESAARFREAYGLNVQGDYSAAGPDGCEKAFACKCSRSLCVFFRSSKQRLCTDGSVPLAAAAMYDGIYGNASFVSEYLRTTPPYNESWAPSCFAIITMGDEIAIPLPDSNPTPQKQAQSEVEFRRWAREERKLSLSEVGCNESLGWDGCRWNATPSGNASNPRLFYYSKVWSFQWGSLQLKKFTDAITAHLPHVGVGANFSPSDYENEVRRLIPPQLTSF